MGTIPACRHCAECAGAASRPTPSKKLCATVGCTKFEGITEIEQFESIVRDDLNENSLRAMGRRRSDSRSSSKNYPADLEEEFEVPNHPQKEECGTRNVPFSKELWVERTDYMDDAPNKFKGFTVGREVTPARRLPRHLRLR